MKKGLLFIASIVFLALSCKQASPEPFQTGDLVFVNLPLKKVDGQDSTKTTLIHVGILEVDQQDSLWIVDVTLKHGVMRDSLATFFRDFKRSNGKYPEMIVMRLKDTTHVAEYVRKAESFIGQPYDFDFEPDNGALYCTELVYDSYVTPDGEHLFKEISMNFKEEDGNYSIYWQNLFNRINVPIPQGHMGTTPDSMMESECLRPVRNSLVK